MAADKKPAGVDVVLAMEGPKKPSVDETESDLPPDYVASFKDYLRNPTPQTFWDAVKSCMEAGEEMKESGKPGGY